MLACNDLLNGSKAEKKGEIGTSYYNSDEDVDEDVANSLTANDALPTVPTKMIKAGEQLTTAGQQKTAAKLNKMVTKPVAAPLKSDSGNAALVGANAADFNASIQALHDKMNMIIAGRGMYGVGSATLLPTDNNQKTVVLTLSHIASPLELENMRASQKGLLPQLTCTLEDIGEELGLPKGVTAAGITKMTIISVQNAAPYSLGVLAPPHLKTPKAHIKEITAAGSFLAEVAPNQTIDVQIPIYECTPSVFKQNLAQKYPGVTAANIGDGFERSLKKGMLWVPLDHAVMVSIKSNINKQKLAEEQKGLEYTGPTIEGMKKEGYGYHVPEAMVKLGVNEMSTALMASNDTLDVKSQLYLNYARSNLSAGKKLSANDQIWTDPLELGTNKLDKQYQLRVKIAVQYTDPNFQIQDATGLASQ